MTDNPRDRRKADANAERKGHAADRRRTALDHRYQATVVVELPDYLVAKLDHITHGAYPHPHQHDERARWRAELVAQAVAVYLHRTESGEL